MLLNKRTKQMYAEGGMMQDGGTVDPVSGNEVPVGSLQEEVRDDIPAKLSEGEFVVPADVVRYIGLEKLMKMRDAAKEGLERMEDVGQMGNADTAPAADEDFDDGFDTEIDDIIGEVDGELQMAKGGFVSGEDLSKAPKNTAVDVRYFKHPDGRMMFVTFINNRPMTAIPEGFTQTDSPERQVGKAADERKEAAESGGSGGDGGEGGAGVPSGEGGSGVFGVDALASTGLGLMAAGEKLGKVPSIQARLLSKASTFAGQKIADTAMDRMTDASNKVAAPPALPGMGTFAAKDGSISTISTPDLINKADMEQFGVTSAQLDAERNARIADEARLAEQSRQEDAARAEAAAIAQAERDARVIDDARLAEQARQEDQARVEAANRAEAAAAEARARAEIEAQQRAAAEARAKQDAATKAAAEQAAREVANNPGGWSDSQRSEAAETGMVSVGGVSVSNDATIAAQDAAMFGDSSSDSSSNSGGGGKIVCTAMNQTYGFGSFRNQIWLSYSRNHLTKEHEVGYHTLFLPLVDIGYNQGDKMHNRVIRTALEHIARHRTADLRAEMRDSKRDVLGRTYRFVLEPLCYVVGKYKLSKK
jgi:hypothetical protein